MIGIHKNLFIGEMNMKTILAITLLLLAATSFASTPTELDCKYLVRSCKIVDNHCFGLPPQYQQLPLSKLQDTYPGVLTSEVQSEIVLNNVKLNLNAKAEFNTNVSDEGIPAVHIDLVDAASGITLSSQGRDFTELGWSQKGQVQSLLISCALK
jgi:hypothetical protein